MHRLSRQILYQKHIPRVLYAQQPSGSSNVRSAVLRCRYASSGSPKQVPDKFERLYASLRHGMKEDELAMTIAALVLSTSSESKLETLQSSISHFLRGHNRDSLYTKVNHYISNPPQDNFNSLADPLSTDAPTNTSPRAAPSWLTTTKPVERTPDSVEYDPSLPGPKEQLMEFLRTLEARQILESFRPDEMKEFEHLFFRTIAENGEDDMEALDRIAQFLSFHGLEIRYTNRIQPKSTEMSELTAEMEALDAAIKAEDAEDGVLPDEALDTELSDPDVEHSKRLAEDSSLNPLTTPAVAQNDLYPDLMTPDPLMDSRDVVDFPPDKNSPYHNRVIVRNNTSIFNEALEEDGFDFDAEDYKPTTTDETEESASSRENLPLTQSELGKLYRFPLIRRRITQQTGKGKIHRQFVLMVVGNGDGLVGYGQGKDEDTSRAEAKAYAQAVRNMDWVERFEKRTIWTEMDAKLGATQLILRPRPVGFGLRCNPNLHQVLKAAGIKDISAKVWGSRNPINVIKAAFRMLQAGHAPLAMGDGIGGPGRKLNKGSGLRSKGDVERERGRPLISLRK